MRGFCQIHHCDYPILPVSSFYQIFPYMHKCTLVGIRVVVDLTGIEPVNPNWQDRIITT